jgi:hypothetical protein
VLVVELELMSLEQKQCELEEMLVFLTEQQLVTQ